MNLDTILEDNKYGRWYRKLIKTRLNIGKDYDVYYENHHIVPKCLGGKECVKLTAREHYIAHLLLCKGVKVKYRKQMLYAFMSMRRSPRGNGNRHRSRLYERHKKMFSEINKGPNNYFYGKRLTGSRNGFYGKTHSDDFKRRHSELCKEIFKGQNNPFYGKTHGKDARKKMSMARRKYVGDKHPMWGKSHRQVKCSCGKKLAYPMWVRWHKSKGHTCVQLNQ